MEKDRGVRDRNSGKRVEDRKKKPWERTNEEAWPDMDEWREYNKAGKPVPYKEWLRRYETEHSPMRKQQQSLTDEPPKVVGKTVRNRGDIILERLQRVGEIVQFIKPRQQK